MTISNAMNILKCLVAGTPPPPAEDPAALVAAAMDHRMSGLLWSSVERGELGLPADTTRFLAMESLRVARRNKMLESGLRTAAERLGEIGVVPGTFKGVTAEQRWYSRCGERPTLDIDLFLDPSDVRRVDEIIETLDPGSRYSGRAARLAAKGLQTLDLQVLPHIWVDLHFDVIKWEIPTRNPALMMTHTERYRLSDGRDVMVLDPTMSLLVTLINVNRDRFRTMLGLADVVRIIDKEDIDWDAFDRFVTAEGWKVHVYKTLAMISEILELDFGGAPTPRLDGWRARAWDAVWSRDVILPGTAAGLTTHRRRYFWGPFLAEGRLVDAARWWFRRVVPSSEMIDFWYPDESGPSLVKLARGRLRVRREERKRQEALLDATESDRA